MHILNKMFFSIEISLLLLLSLVILMSNEVDGQSNFSNSIENEVAKDYDPSGNLQIDVTIEGTAYDDKLRGGDGNDKIFGKEGNDIIIGEDGDDLLLGNEGDDILTGKEGDDELEGGEGNDQLDGGLGEDKLEGGEGSDEFICDLDDEIIDFDYIEGDTTNGTCEIKDKSPSSEKYEDKNNDKYNKDSNGKIFPN